MMPHGPGGALAERIYFLNRYKILSKAIHNTTATLCFIIIEISKAKQKYHSSIKTGQKIGPNVLLIDPIFQFCSETNILRLNQKVK